MSNCQGNFDASSEYADNDYKIPTGWENEMVNHSRRVNNKGELMDADANQEICAEIRREQKSLMFARRTKSCPERKELLAVIMIAIIVLLSPAVLLYCGARGVWTGAKEIYQLCKLWRGV